MTLSWWLIRSFSFAEEATWMSASLCQMLVTLGRPGESLHQPRGQGQSLPFNGAVAVYICRLPSLCVVSWEEGGACTPNPWEIHAQPRFEIRVFTMVGRNCLSVVSMCSSGRTSTLMSYSREQQKKSKMHLPRIDSFLLKSMFLTLFWAHKDGCWVRMNQKCGCISPGGSCISTHRGGAARLSCVDMPQHKQGFLGL